MRVRLVLSHGINFHAVMAREWHEIFLRSGAANRASSRRAIRTDPLPGIRRVGEAPLRTRAPVVGFVRAAADATASFWTASISALEPAVWGGVLGPPAPRFGAARPEGCRATRCAVTARDQHLRPPVPPLRRRRGRRDQIASQGVLRRLAVDVRDCALGPPSFIPMAATARRRQGRSGPFLQPQRSFPHRTCCPRPAG